MKRAYDMIDKGGSAATAPAPASSAPNSAAAPVPASAVSTEHDVIDLDITLLCSERWVIRKVLTAPTRIVVLEVMMTPSLEPYDSILSKHVRVLKTVPLSAAASAATAAWLVSRTLVSVKHQVREPYTV